MRVRSLPLRIALGKCGEEPRLVGYVVTHEVEWKLSGHALLIEYVATLDDVTYKIERQPPSHHCHNALWNAAQKNAPRRRRIRHRGAGPAFV